MTDAENGRGQDTLAHIAQSIRNILFTRIGTRLMREEYGSFIPDLIDMPAGHAAIALIHQAAVTPRKMETPHNRPPHTGRHRRPRRRQNQINPRRNPCRRRRTNLPHQIIKTTG
ncbi:hypothetical protein HUQ87_001414 [Neisseria gonorrhoeae]